jgi:hypothetical protein
MELDHGNNESEVMPGLRSRDLLFPIARFESLGDLPRALFVREALGRAHGVVVTARGEREGDPLSLEEAERLGTRVQASIDRRGVREALLRSDDGHPVFLERGYGGAFEVSVAAADASRADQLAESVAAAIRVVRGAREDRVPVAFWSGAGDGLLSSPEARWRRLKLPCFADIESNYPPGVRSRLWKLLACSTGHALPGRLALWHGSPGTGKTWALRALGREWSEWCDLHYITDPERLLGGDTNYMLGVLAGDSEPPRDDPADHDGFSAGERDSDARWRLLVLEDAGELLGIDAPSEVGRGFARLLNIADGLLGQGTRALILVTTNEPLGKLHPAALRPGRAMVTVEFAPLAPAEATAWLRDRGTNRELRSPTTIAELHCMLEGGSAEVPSRAPVGFG